MIAELLYTVGEYLLYVPDDVAGEDHSREAMVVENALPTAAEVEVHIDGEPEPRAVPAQYLVRHKSRFYSSD